MLTFRAAFTAPMPGDCSLGVLLTMPSHADLPDDQLRAEALRAVAELGLSGITSADIVIGQSTESGWF